MDVEDIQTVAVMGAGNMGHGIAEVAALAGYDVTLRDINEELVQEGYDQIEWSLGKLVENDRIEADERDAALDRVTPLVDVEEAVGDADVVVEAVVEDADIKAEVYEEVCAALPGHAILATNTSSLSITELAGHTDRPEQFCGMHFFNPPVRMDLVEVIAGAESSEATLSTVEDLAESLGKTPVRVHKDSPGFVVNRVLVPLMNEAAWLVEDGTATVETVDSTAKYGVGLPMGAFELADMVGIDVGHAVLEYMAGELGAAYEPCPLIVEKVEHDALGRKSGRGFYEYEDGDGPQIPADAVDETVERRLLAVMANETAKLVGEDVADAEAIDRAVTLGGGFPDGPAKLADRHGVADLVAALEEAHETTGHPRYAVADHLHTVADRGGFYPDDAGDDDATAGYDTLQVEVDEETMVGHVTLDRTHRMNSVSMELMDELDRAFDELADDDDVRAVLLRGAGDRAFSAGADVTAIAASSPIEAVDVISRRGQRVFGKLREMDEPVVAGIDGYCLGGGMELATCADLRVATERSEFGQTEHDLGLLPGWGGTQRLQRIVGEGRAKEIIFTADRFDADTMAEYGFVNEVVENDAIDERAEELAADLAGGPPVAQRLTKRAMHVGGDDLEAGLELEAQAFGHVLSTDDMMEGVSAFMDDREPEFEGK